MSNSALKEIIARAKQIRGGNTQKYAWQQAVRQAAREYDMAHPNPNRKPKQPSIASRVKSNPQLDALYRGYKQELQQLKMRYWQAGLQIKSTQPRKPAPRRSNGGALRRLPPVLL